MARVLTTTGAESGSETITSAAVERTSPLPDLDRISRWGSGRFWCGPYFCFSARLPINPTRGPISRDSLVTCDHDRVLDQSPCYEHRRSPVWRTRIVRPVHVPRAARALAPRGAGSMSGG
jgi:hypothetical protein